MMKHLTQICTYSLMLFCLSVNAQDQITNSGNMMIHGGASVSVYGNLINNGILVDSGQVITLAGTTAQQIGGSSPTTFKNLTLNNSAGSYLSANENIKGELLITSGTFSTTGYDFTLISDINGTARIAPIAGNFAGNITMQRYVGAAPSDWRFLASPVSGVTINDWQDDFVTSGFPGSNFPNFPFVSIYTYDETVGGTCDNGYIGATNASDPIVPGQGYWCYVGPVPLTADVTGPPVIFNHTFQVSYSASAGAPDDGYMMIGNPYPSSINWSSAAWSKNKINDAIYIWNPALQQYASWVQGSSTNGGSNLIASSQSFWIQANAANPSLSCSENIKVSTNAPFIKQAAPPVFSKIKLNFGGNNYKDETLLLFGNGATSNYDPTMDARKLFSSNPLVPGIATLDSTLKDLSINGLPLINSVIHIPVKTIVGVTGTYTIDIDSCTLMPQDFCIVLEDLLTGSKTNLNITSSYSFNISDTTKVARFVLHVSAAHQTESMGASCKLYQDGKAIAVAKGMGPWNYFWFNANNINIKQTFSTFLADTIQNLSAGDYSVQISDNNGICNSFTKKITVTEPPPVYAGFTFVSDTIYSGNTDSLILQNSSSGSMTYTWDFGDASGIDSSYTPSAHHYHSPGSYIITLVVRFNTCSDTLTHKIIVLPSNLVSLNSNRSGTRITVYPNPGNGMFYLKLSDALYENAHIEVSALSGVSIYRAGLLAGETEINLKHQAKGLYLYCITFENNDTNRGKLIIE